MARLIWLLLTVALGGALVGAASWTAASARVSDMLGAPPPQMGNRYTTFLWEGMQRVPGQPKAWLFTYGPTKIPGARNVKIWVSPLGKLLKTEPADLQQKLDAFHAKGF